MAEPSAFKDLWGAVATVGAGIWLVTFALIAFATSKSDILRGYLRDPRSRLTLYCAIALTNANIVSPMLTSLHWLTSVGGRRFVDGGITLGEGLAWLLVIAALAASIIKDVRGFGRVRQTLILCTATSLELFVSYRNLFGSEEWAANGAIAQFAIALSFPMLVVSFVALHREFPTYRTDRKTA